MQERKNQRKLKGQGNVPQEPPNKPERKPRKRRERKRESGGREGVYVRVCVCLNTQHSSYTDYLAVLNYVQ